MVQVSFWWRQVSNLKRTLPQSQLSAHLLPSLSRRQWRQLGRWLLSLTALAALWYWNWKLLLATSAGVGLMMLAYLMPVGNWQVYWSRWRRFFRGSNLKLTLAVGSGGLAALGTYMAASIWAGSPNRWLAVGTILQGWGTFLTLLLLVWHIIHQQGEWHQGKFDQLLADLTAADPLKRLIAVRQLTRWSNRCPLGERQQLEEYFRLMLAQERQPTIRKALLDSLQRYQQN